MLGTIGHFVILALVTLPLAGLPLTIWLLLDYRRDSARQDTRPHVVMSP